MKGILISAVLTLALAGTTAFAAQSKTATAKNSVAKPAVASTMPTTASKNHAVKKRKKHAAKTTASSNAAGTMTGAAKKPATKKGNSK